MHRKMEKLLAKMTSGEAEGSLEAFKYNVDMQLVEIENQGVKFHLAKRKSMMDGTQVGYGGVAEEEEA